MYLAAKPLLLASVLLTLSSCVAVYQPAMPASALHSQNATQLAALSQSNGLNKRNALGQLDVLWPETASQRAWVNNRRSFIGYQGQGELLLELGTTTALTLSVNGKILHLRPDAKLGQHLALDISAVTRNGINQLELVDIEPLGAKVRVVLPYPVLQDNTAKAAHNAGFSAAVLAELDQLIQREVEQGFPGAVLLIAKDGKIIKETAYGYASRYASDGTELSQPEPMQTDTVFDLASNTKMYATNYAIMQLVSAGKLDINLPLQHYLTEYQGNGREQRLVSDLLYHSAGYAPEVHFHRPDNRHGPAFYSLDRARSMQLIASEVPFERERGGKAVYSDIDYMLLGLLIERITGQAQDEYLEQQLYRPMGLNSTVFNPLRKGIAQSRIAATELDGNSRGGRVSFPADIRGVVRGNVHDEKARYAFDGVAGHAGLFSTARETATLAMLALHGGYGLTPVFSQAVIQQFVRPSVTDHTVGLGWRTAVGGDLNWHFGPYASPYAFGHTGWTGTATLVDPYYGLVVVLLTNKKHSPVLAEGENSYYFAGDRFETGMYGSIMSKIYQAMQ
ncbi:penicillin binding protein PBP4B [Rheinheimera sp. EpRS3]|uniref:penicillin binding protein PBP4B n=1 Tax=Rheinheimera sp. EpRS3 TaxID=1712383 RepID=UPI00074A067B|nr:penicillin binding protein PBP4B [Rheinheimera sp. EpRS3]KUM53819.1 N-acetylmuramoyl-L-alanine amidase [Rheinheimera sp. EpRS3]